MVTGVPSTQSHGCAPHLSKLPPAIDRSWMLTLPSALMSGTAAGRRCLAALPPKLPPMQERSADLHPAVVVGVTAPEPRVLDRPEARRTSAPPASVGSSDKGRVSAIHLVVRAGRHYRNVEGEGAVRRAEACAGWREVAAQVSQRDRAGVDVAGKPALQGDLAADRRRTADRYGQRRSQNAVQELTIPIGHCCVAADRDIEGAGRHTGEDDLGQRA